MSEQLAWAAGLFEGEGCMRKCGVRSVTLTVTSTDRDVLERFRAVVDCGYIRERKLEWGHLGGKPVFVWDASAAADVRPLLECFLPWLGERRRARAEEMLERLAENRGPNGAKTHCVRGHPLSGANLYLGRTGRRYCRACRKHHRRTWRTRAGEVRTRV